MDSVDTTLAPWVLQHNKLWALHITQCARKALVCLPPHATIVVRYQIIK